MSNAAFKDGRYPIELDKVRYLKFSLNAMADCEDRFGSLEKISDALTGVERIKNVRWLLTLLINEGRNDEEPEVSEREVGRLIHAGNLSPIIKAIMDTMVTAQSGDDPVDREEDEVPEGEARTGKSILPV